MNHDHKNEWSLKRVLVLQCFTPPQWLVSVLNGRGDVDAQKSFDTRAGAREAADRLRRRLCVVARMRNRRGREAATGNIYNLDETWPWRAAKTIRKKTCTGR